MSFSPPVVNTPGKHIESVINSKIPIPWPPGPIVDINNTVDADLSIIRNPQIMDVSRNKNIVFHSADPITFPANINAYTEPVSTVLSKFADKWDEIYFRKQFHADIIAESHGILKNEVKSIQKSIPPIVAIYNTMVSSAKMDEFMAEKYKKLIEPHIVVLTRTFMYDEVKERIRLEILGLLFSLYWSTGMSDSQFDIRRIEDLLSTKTFATKYMRVLRKLQEDYIRLGVPYRTSEKYIQYITTTAKTSLCINTGYYTREDARFWIKVYGPDNLNSFLTRLIGPKVDTIQYLKDISTGENGLVQLYAYKMSGTNPDPEMDPDRKGTIPAKMVFAGNTHIPDERFKFEKEVAMHYFFLKFYPKANSQKTIYQKNFDLIGTKKDHIGNPIGFMKAAHIPLGVVNIPEFQGTMVDTNSLNDQTARRDCATRSDPEEKWDVGMMVMGWMNAEFFSFLYNSSGPDYDAYGISKFTKFTDVDSNGVANDHTKDDANSPIWRDHTGGQSLTELQALERYRDVVEKPFVGKLFEKMLMPMARIFALLLSMNNVGIFHGDIQMRNFEINANGKERITHAGLNVPGYWDMNLIDFGEARYLPLQTPFVYQKFDHDETLLTITDTFGTGAQVREWVPVSTWLKQCAPNIVGSEYAILDELCNFTAKPVIPTLDWTDLNFDVPEFALKLIRKVNGLMYRFPTLPSISAPLMDGTKYDIGADKVNRSCIKLIKAIAVMSTWFDIKCNTVLYGNFQTVTGGKGPQLNVIKGELPKLIHAIKLKTQLMYSIMVNPGEVTVGQPINSRAYKHLTGDFQKTKNNDIGRIYRGGYKDGKWIPYDNTLTGMTWYDTKVRQKSYGQLTLQDHVVRDIPVYEYTPSEQAKFIIGNSAASNIREIGLEDDIKDVLAKLSSWTSHITHNELTAYKDLKDLMGIPMSDKLTLLDIMFGVENANKRPLITYIQKLGIGYVDILRFTGELFGYTEKTGQKEDGYIGKQMKISNAFSENFASMFVHVTGGSFVYPFWYSWVFFHMSSDFDVSYTTLSHMYNATNDKMRALTLHEIASKTIIPLILMENDRYKHSITKHTSYPFYRFDKSIPNFEFQRSSSMGWGDCTFYQGVMLQMFLEDIEYKNPVNQETDFVSTLIRWKKLEHIASQHREVYDTIDNSLTFNQTKQKIQNYFVVPANVDSIATSLGIENNGTMKKTKFQFITTSHDPVTW